MKIPARLQRRAQPAMAATPAPRGPLMLGIARG
jgi:hypothetical protein